MKDNKHLLSPLIMRITSSILYGLSFGAMITLFLFRLSGHSLVIKYGLIFGIGMIPGLFFYFLVFPWIAGYLNELNENKKNRSYGFLLLIPGILLLFVTYKLSFQPSFHHLEIAYTENDAAKASSQNIQLAEVKLSKTGIIPLEKISTSQRTENKKTSAEVTSLPLPVNYTFLSLQEGETVDILLSVIPPGRGVSIQFDGEKTFLFPLNDKPDQILRTFRVNNYFSSLEILLFCLGLGSILGAMILIFNSQKDRSAVGLTGERQVSREDVDIPFAKVFSVILGVCLAVGIALFFSAIVPTRFDNYALRNTIDASNYAFNDLKIREKVFFALFYILGFGLSVIVSARLVKPIMRPLAGIVGILSWMPVVNYSAFLVMQSHPLRFIWLAFCFVSLFLIAIIAYTPKQNMAWAAATGYIVLWLFGISQSPYLFVKPDLSLNLSMQRMALFCIALILLFAALCRMQLKTKVRNILYACMVIIVLFLIIIPASPPYIAADMAGDAHAPFHLFAPALYSRFAQSFTPGYEYFSQYGVGAPFLFSPLLGETAAATLVNYVVLIAGLMFVFYLVTYLVLKKLFDSGGWAFTIVLVSLFLQFWGVGMHLRAPSMLVFRYALFPFILALLVYWVKMDFSQWGTLLLSMLVGFSIFWTTETGISFFVAVCASIIIFLGISRRSILLLISFSIEAIIIFFGLSAIAFGGRVFSLNYIYEGILSPLIIYGSGFGALPIGWQDYLSYIINFIVPMLSIAGLGVIYHMNRSKGETILSINDRAMLVFCSVLSILFSAKYLNRSDIQNWHATVLPSLIVTAYWIKLLGTYLSSHTSGIHLSLLQRYSLKLNYGYLITVLVLGMGALYLFYTTELGYSSDALGLRSYGSYDSLLNHYVLQIPREKEGISDSFLEKQDINPEDTALIQKYSKPNTPVMLIGFDPVQEWKYYLASKRIPASPVVPTKVIFSQWQADVFLANIPNIIFLPYKDNLNEKRYLDDLDLDHKIKTDIIPKYSLIDETNDLFVYRRP